MSDEREMHIEDGRRLRDECYDIAGALAELHQPAARVVVAGRVWQLVREAYLSGYDRRARDESASHAALLSLVADVPCSTTPCTSIHEEAVDLLRKLRPGFQCACGYCPKGQDDE